MPRTAEPFETPQPTMPLPLPRLRNPAAQVEASEVRFTVRDTSSGRYQSITLHAPVKNATMLYKCYELIDEVSYVTTPNPCR